MAKQPKPEYSRFKAFFLSFYSKDLYVDVFTKWKGVGFLYALLASLCIAIICSGIVAYQANTAYVKHRQAAQIAVANQNYNKLFSTVLPLQINDGNLIKPTGKPAIVKSQYGRVHFVKTIPNYTTPQAKAQLYIAKNEVIFIPKQQTISNRILINTFSNIPASYTLRFTLPKQEIKLTQKYIPSLSIKTTESNTINYLLMVAAIALFILFAILAITLLRNGFYYLIHYRKIQKLKAENPALKKYSFLASWRTSIVIATPAAAFFFITRNLLNLNMTSTHIINTALVISALIIYRLYGRLAKKALLLKIKNSNANEVLSA